MSTSEYNSGSYYNTSWARPAESETQQDQENEPQPDISVQASSDQSSSEESVSQKIENYGQQLQNDLRLRGWTQDQLAEEIGVSKTDVQNWEDNQSVPDLASRQKLSQLFGNDFYVSKESHESRLPSGDGVPEAPLVTEPERFPLAWSNEERERAIEGNHEQSSQTTPEETIAEATDEQPTQDRKEGRKVSVNYGQQLQRERKRKGWTQEWLARKMGVPVSKAISWEKNLSYPDRLSRRKLAELLGKDIYRTSQTDGTLQIRITQEQLTAQNFTTIISALTELHTTCWLIQQSRFVQAIEYTQTHNMKFVEEANLVITRLAYNSPLAITFAPLDPKNIADALGVAIDNAVQARQRLIALRIANQEKAEQIQQAAKRAEQEYQAKQQELTIAAQKAAQESQMAQIEQERLRLDLERQRLTFQIEPERQKLELEKQRVELATMRMNYAVETANQMIGMLQPNADQTTRAMLVQTLIPSLLQLDSSKGLNLSLPVPQNSIGSSLLQK